MDQPRSHLAALTSRRRWRDLLPAGIFNRRERPTRVGYIWFGLLMIVAAAAFNTSNNMLFLVLGLMLAALLASFLISEYMIAQVKVSRDAPAIVTAGEGFRVSYTIKNEKKLLPSLALRLTEGLAAGRVMAVATYLGAGRQDVVRGSARLSRRGRARFGKLVISTSAPFGWMEKEREVELGGELIVLPRSDPAGVDRERLLAAGEERPRSRPGRGDELFGFRDYRRGDPVKDVHWKTTARSGALMVREREADEERRLRLALRLEGPRPPEDPAREAAIERAASMAEAGIESGWLVRLEVGDKGVDFGAGPAHLHQILVFLALFDDPETPAGETLAPTEVEAVIVQI